MSNVLINVLLQIAVIAHIHDPMLMSYTNIIYSLTSYGNITNRYKNYSKRSINLIVTFRSLFFPSLTSLCLTFISLFDVIYLLLI